jgi:hypothetical protein
MIKKHWYKPRFWGWWWQHRAPDRFRVGLALGVCVAAGGAGYLASGRLAPAHAATITTVGVRTVRVVDVHTVKVTVTGVTVRRTLTVREKGRVVPVVHKVVGAPSTTYLTTTNTIYLTRNVTVPVTNTVTVTGRSQTVVQTRLVPTVVTHTNVVTHQVTQTVVQVLTQ